MKRLVYAGVSLTTSDAVADVVIELAAELARQGLAEAICVPAVGSPGDETEEATLVVGVGNDIAAMPDRDWDGRETVFPDHLEELSAQLDRYARRGPAPLPLEETENVIRLLSHGSSS